MIKNISLWIKQIILIVMFATFIDFLMPSRFSKYIRVLLGLLVMMTILNPILVLLNRNFSINDIQSTRNSKNGFINQEDILNQSNDFKIKNDEILLKYYKENIKSFISQQVNQNTSFEIKHFDLIAIEDSNANFGKIKELRIVVSPKSHKVSVNINGKREELHEDMKNELFELKQQLQRQFDICENNIYLYLEG